MNRIDMVGKNLICINYIKIFERGEFPTISLYLISLFYTKKKFRLREISIKARNKHVNLSRTVSRV